MHLSIRWSSRLARWLAVVVVAPFLVTYANAMSLSTTSLTVTVGGTGTVVVSGISGSFSVKSSDYSVFNVTASAVSSGTSTVTVTGVKVGTGRLNIKDASGTKYVSVSVKSATTVSTAGRLLASNCFQCHGTNGTGGFDTLRGQTDIENELNSFANSIPTSEHYGSIMWAHSLGYTKEQMKLIGDFFKTAPAAP